MRAAKPTIVLIGLGHLGGVFLEFLARAAWVGRIVACNRDPGHGEARCNLARIGAIADSQSPEIEYRQIDITETDRFAKLLDSVAPDVVLSTATMQTWWLPDLLPPAARESLREARFGVWLPLHLAPTLALMQAVNLSSFVGPVLTAPFPDVVNCVLGRIGLAPSCGIGNIDEMVAKVRWSASQFLQAPLSSIQAIMVGHHALQSSVFAGGPQDGPPFFLRVLHEGDDVTDSLPIPEILFSPYPLPDGPGTAFFTAGSTMRLLGALLGESRVCMHAPGPGGLPGGYPVMVGDRHIDVARIDGLSPEEAVDINESSHRFDGIERIEDDGTVVYVRESAEIMRTELGFDCAVMAPADAAVRGQELAARFQEYAARHGVDLARMI